MLWIAGFILGEQSRRRSHHCLRAAGPASARLASRTRLRIRALELRNPKWHSLSERRLAGRTRRKLAEISGAGFAPSIRTEIRRKSRPCAPGHSHRHSFRRARHQRKWPGGNLRSRRAVCRSLSPLPGFSVGFSGVVVRPFMQWELIYLCRLECRTVYRLDIAVVREAS